MKIDIKSDLDLVTKKLIKDLRRQVPFAASKALNSVAFDIQRELKKQTPKYVDRPQPFTIKGIVVQKSHKKDLEALIEFKRDRAKYMDFLIAGGTRKAFAGRALAVPTANAKPNKYGNQPRHRLAKFLAQPNKYFSGVPKGSNVAPGVFKRVQRNHKLVKMFSWETSTKYKPQFPFDEIAEKKFAKLWKPALLKELNEAIRTADKKRR